MSENNCHGSPYPVMDPRSIALHNSELRKLATDVVNAAKYAVCVAAAEPGRNYPAGTLEATVAAAVDSFQPERRDQVQTRAASVLELPSEARAAIFGRYGQIDPGEVVRVGYSGMGSLVPAVRIDNKLLGQGTEDRQGPAPLDRLEYVWGSLRQLPPDLHTLGLPVTAPDISTGEPSWASLHHERLDFRIRWIHCVDETNPEQPGSDEIGIGGVATHTLGSVSAIPSKTFTGFDDNNKEYFDEHWVFASFDLPPAQTDSWIYDYYHVTVALAELDQGGFGQFLTELYDAIREEVAAAVMAAVFAGTVGVLGPALAAVLAALAAWAFDKLVEFFLGLFGDDVFPPQNAQLQVSRNFQLAGNGWFVDGVGLRSPDRDLHFYGHGGHYTVRYNWRLVHQ